MVVPTASSFAGGLGAGGCAGFCGSTGAAPKSMVAPASSVGLVIGFAAGIADLGGVVFIAAAALNIIVRPAASSASGAADGTVEVPAGAAGFATAAAGFGGTG